MFLDVTDTASITAVADAAVAQLGGIDIWVSNAGIYPSHPLLEMKDEDWDRVLNINLRGLFIASREAARRMIAAKRGGVIVNMSSTAGFKGATPGVAHYVASKHAVRGVTRQMAVELAPHDIRVLAVAPCLIDTDGASRAAAEQPKLKKLGVDVMAQLTSRFLGREAVRPDDIARVVLFCASDLAIFMTGTIGVLVDAMASGCDTRRRRGFACQLYLARIESVRRLRPAGQIASGRWASGCSP